MFDVYIAGLFIRAPVEEIMIGENDPSDHDDGAIDDLIRINGRRTATWRKLTTSKWATQLPKCVLNTFPDYNIKLFRS